MKILISSITLIVIFSITTFAQTKKISVVEKSSSFINGKHNSLCVSIYEADENLIEKEWKRYMKDYKAKVSTKKEIFADNALIKNLSVNTVDVYAKIEKNSSGDFDLIVAFDLGGAYLSGSTHSVKYKAAEDLVYNFAVKTTKEAIKNLVRDEEKILVSMEKSLEQLKKDKENLKTDIENYKEKISKAEKNIITNEKSQTDKIKEIEKQKTVVTIVQKRVESVK